MQIVLPTYLQQYKTHITANAHIAVMKQPFLQYVFDGKKTIESRFSLHKIAPYKKVQPGDLVFMKAGPIVGCFTVSWVKYYDLQERSIEEIQHNFGTGICGDTAFWHTKKTKRYATVIGITHVYKIEPIPIEKHDRRAWVAL